MTSYILIPNEDGTWRKEKLNDLEDVAVDHELSKSVAAFERTYHSLLLQNNDLFSRLEFAVNLFERVLIEAAMEITPDTETAIRSFVEKNK